MKRTIRKPPQCRPFRGSEDQFSDAVSGWGWELIKSSSWSISISNQNIQGVILGQGLESGTVHIFRLPHFFPNCLCRDADNPKWTLSSSLRAKMITQYAKRLTWGCSSGKDILGSHFESLTELPEDTLEQQQTCRRWWNSNRKRWTLIETKTLVIVVLSTSSLIIQPDRISHSK